MGTPLDTYNWRARVAPVLIMLMPLGFAAAAFFPKEKGVVGALASLGGTAALTVLLAHVGRDLGRRRQAELFEKWGGSPTVRMLALRTSTLNSETLRRYRDRLCKAQPTLVFPTDQDEAADPAAADMKYESAVDYLRSATRDRSKFRLVLEENMNFGFRRNLWALKPAGSLITLIGLGLCVALASYRYLHNEEIAPATIVGAVACTCLLVLWGLRIDEDWVREAADAYARQLLASCDELEITKESK